MGAYTPTEPERNQFIKDFLPLLTCCRNFGHSERSEFLHKQHLAIVNAYAEAFSRKYRTLQVKIERDRYDISQPVLLLRDEVDFYNVFLVAHSFIKQMLSVNFKVEGISRAVEPDKFAAVMPRYRKELLESAVHFRYVHEGVSREVVLKHNAQYNMIQLADTEFMFDTNDPEFLLCMYYAFDKGYDASVDLSEYSSLFSSRASSDPSKGRGFSRWL
jgi:hypothetical protein